MKASAAQQADLLSLANLDNEISRSRTAIKNLSSGAQFAQLRESQRNLAAKLINARNALDTVELELKRSETDLELVEQRIAKDVSRLSTTNNSKDAQGIQSELESLNRRKSLNKRKRQPLPTRPFPRISCQSMKSSQPARLETRQKL
jgi:predicted  nucleic acid-binding Zn-ribbon protein